MMLWILRVVFLLMAAGAGARLERTAGSSYPWVCFLSVMVVAVGVVIADVAIKRKQIGVISAIYFGLIVGLVLSYLLFLAVEPTIRELDAKTGGSLASNFPWTAAIIFCYICVSLILQTKDSLRFVIPYVEFAPDFKGAQPLVLDTSVIIDGRIADVAETRIFDQPLVVPRFVLRELQAIADSSDKLRRNRGRRGLDVLNKLQTNGKVEIQIHETDVSEQEPVEEVDQRLVLLAKHLSGRVITNDYNLNKVARLQGVEVINLNDLANALKPVVLPGESMSVKLIKLGEEPGQGVGYLDDGTMVVAEQGRGHIGEVVRLIVTSVLQTSAGRMIFGRLESSPGRH